MIEKIKVALIAIIAITLIVNTYHDFSKENSENKTSEQITSKIAAKNSPSVKSVQQNKKPSAPPTTIKFDEMEYDFGNIKQNTKNEHIFKFTNTGKNPLIIEDARGSCGCTVPKWPKEPIPPGGTGEIQVVYSPGKQKGQQTKTVTIKANTEPPTTILKIKAFVEEVNENE